MEDNFTVKNAAVKNGVMLGLISIVIGLLNQVMGWYTNETIGYVMMVVGIGLMIVFIVRGHNAFKENNDGYMSYGKGLGIGTLMVLISSVLSSAFNFIYLSYVDGAQLDFMREKQIEALQERGMGQAEIDAALPTMEMFSGPVAMLIFGILGGLLFGFIASLIVSIFTKNPDPSLEI